MGDAYVTCLKGAFNFINSWSFTEDLAQRAVSEQANYFRLFVVTPTMNPSDRVDWKCFGPHRSASCSAVAYHLLIAVMRTIVLLSKLTS